MPPPRTPIRITQSNQKVVECPICYEIPKRNIYQCSNGHAICSNCCFRVNKCPFCQAGGRVRARAMECMLDACIYECPNKGLGCQELLKRENINHHLKHCAAAMPAIRVRNKRSQVRGRSSVTPVSEISAPPPSALEISAPPPSALEISAPPPSALEISAPPPSALEIRSPTESDLLDLADIDWTDWSSPPPLPPFHIEHPNRRQHITRPSTHQIQDLDFLRTLLSAALCITALLFVTYIQSFVF